MQINNIFCGLVKCCLAVVLVSYTAQQVFCGSFLTKEDLTEKDLKDQRDRCSLMLLRKIYSKDFPEKYSDEEADKILEQTIKYPPHLSSWKEMAAKATDAFLSGREHVADKMLYLRRYLVKQRSLYSDFFTKDKPDLQTGQGDTFERLLYLTAKAGALESLQKLVKRFESKKGENFPEGAKRVLLSELITSDGSNSSCSNASPSITWLFRRGAKLTERSLDTAIYRRIGVFEQYAAVMGAIEHGQHGTFRDVVPDSNEFSNWEQKEREPFEAYYWFQRLKSVNWAKSFEANFQNFQSLKDLRPNHDRNKTQLSLLIGMWQAQNHLWSGVQAVRSLRSGNIKDLMEKDKTMKECNKWFVGGKDDEDKLQKYSNKIGELNRFFARVAQEESPSSSIGAFAYLALPASDQLPSTKVLGYGNIRANNKSCDACNVKNSSSKSYNNQQDFRNKLSLEEKQRVDGIRKLFREAGQDSGHPLTSFLQERCSDSKLWYFAAKGTGPTTPQEIQFGSDKIVMPRELLDTIGKYIPDR